MTILFSHHRTAERIATARRTSVRPATELSRLTRYRGGTYSHTVEKVLFTDGTSARTDLIRLNPNVPAYSLDFTGVAPNYPSRYEPGTWSELPHLRVSGKEAEVDWILRHSYPLLPIGELSRRVREAGYPIGAANISEHEAIAATQAAIWFLTNGLALETRPLNVPVAVRRAAGVTTFEFDGEPQLGGYSVWSRSSAELRLQKSSNGLVWHDVSGSLLTTGAEAGRYQRTLGEGSTLSASSHGRGGRGYRYYRLIATSEAGAPRIDHVSFWLTGSRHYRNSDKVVHLYNYLLAGSAAAARAAQQTGGEPALVDSDAVADADLIGPFQVTTRLSLTAPEDHHLVCADGFPVESVAPHTDFYVRRVPGSSGVTLTAKTPADLHGRVLTGVALDPAAHRFTPVALAIPTETAIEFDISWEADEL
ncbi:TQXA domain-containing protein [Candidatus Mycobacterium wuenschmannii]|uniref:TQXA domain-containing protein n=1 Tax=Candidatus Mycobacterium wuenschmannii TaxID=3027808 RepID=A0ABY8W2X6_9MYCO|nr:TQXA domain-containing protein [Candidatus Mycobacterium wuenschmannii]WIM89354.1 TQXA domain-containing protein [Candidatus Mycobacterium wuenschmannii]